MKQEENLYELWKQFATADADIKKELEEIAGNEAEIDDRFYRDLEFGTGGLRGVIGAGTNRMNIYTVGKASQGLANYLKEQYETPSIAIAYDSRIKSEVFAKRAAGVFAANGILVHIYKELMPTPALSFAVRELGCSAGVVVTASHNPSKYNGYKVYGADGCQITLEAAKAVLSHIEQVDLFTAVKTVDFEQGLAEGSISIIGEEVFEAYMKAVSTQAICRDIDKNVSIVYTPLNGSGRRCVTTCLSRNGFTNIVIPKEQEMPDGNFPTCPYPNPEIREALSVGLQKAEEIQSDLLLATDPDCDRVGVAVKTAEGYTLISGNQMGVLLLDYICKMRIAAGTMPERPVAVSTIVSTKMIDRLAEKYGVTLRRVLTGFKFIGEQIGFLEQAGEADRYIFGFEESYGYLSGSFVRDKDGVNASLLICEMFAYYKGQGKSLVDVLEDLYAEHGVFLEEQQSAAFEGESGFTHMQEIMNELRTHTPESIIQKRVVAVSDYLTSEKTLADGTKIMLDLPASNVIELNLEGDVTAIVRPSGTEPKLKIYYSVKADKKETGLELIEQLKGFFAQIVK